MPSRSDRTGILRALFVSYVSLIPWVFQREVFPPFAFPLAVLAGIALARLSASIKLRLLPAVFTAVALEFLLIKGFRLAALLFQDSAISEWYVRISLISIPLATGTLIVFLSTRLQYRFTAWKRAEPFVILAAIALSFWSQGLHRLTAFTHPLKAAAFALIAVFLALLSLFYAIPREDRRFASLYALAPLLIFGALASVKSFNAAAVSANGGLIQPTLFRFDFSTVLSLQSDITLNNRLVLIVHAPEEYQTALLRRMYLPAWDPKKGFFEAPVPGSAPQELTVNASPKTLPDPGYELRSTVRQEYFIVNFDPKSLIAMDYPVRIEPYRLWQTESFNGAYAVTSRVTGFIPFELYDAPAPFASSGENGIPAEALAYYTSIDAETRSYVEPIARTVTEGISGYYDRVFALNAWLRGDSFRYSLHPGEAPDGNQLRYFLTGAKKGYCTYYAFSLALMCRSLGIPARVAAGFFISPDSGSLDYFPVRSNMAHAWVEVFFPKYGWISFDPTNQIPAEGENLQFDANPRGDEFMSLLDEIIGKKGELQVSDGSILADSPIDSGWLPRFRKFLLATARASLPWAFLFLLIVPIRIIARSIIFRYSKRPRTVILLAERLTQRRRKKLKTDRERALADELTALANKARFASECMDTEAQRARDIVKTLAVKSRPARLPAIALLFALWNPALSRLDAQTIPATPDATAETAVPEGPVPTDATALLERARRAASVENWDLATTLLLEGKKSYPKDGSFPQELGGIFLDQSLYPAAIREFELALTLGVTDSGIYLQLSDATGYENRDEESLQWIRRYLGLVPDNLSAWATFGWLCYKTHRLDEGISTLTHVLETWGPDGNVYVGLGNLYSAAYNYDQARLNYSKAIKLAEENDQQYLASVYLYNRSILEETFYRFDNAYRDTELSLENSPRASGYLMQAELEMRKLDYSEALRRYMKASTLDSTPLATIGLAETYLEAGMPDKSFIHIQSVKANVDTSWIANYGTTTQQFKSDMYRLERDYWHFMKFREQRKVVHSLYTFLVRQYWVIHYSIKEWLYDATYRIATLQVAKKYQQQEQEYDSQNGQGIYEHSYKYLAYDRWQEQALPHLLQAQRIETEHVALAKPSYDYEQGVLTSSTFHLDTAISTLDPVWERNYLAEALSKRLLLSNSAETSLIETYSYRLYQIDPAQFIFDNIRLPVRIAFDPQISDSLSRRITRSIRQAGFSRSQTSALTVVVEKTAQGLKIYLQDDHGIITVSPQIIHNSTPSQQDVTSFINSFSTDVFSAKIGQ